MRIASFNVESLFERAKALNEPKWSDGKAALEQHAKVNTLLCELVYTAAIQAQVVDLLDKLGLSASDDGGTYARLRQNRGRLLRRVAGKIQIVAGGRLDWIGWVELKTEPVNELATTHTADVLRDVNADIQVVIEAESRVSLRDFSSIMLQSVGGVPFEHVMLIDGNDDRGIDVGILTRAGYPLSDIRSHVDDADASGPIFSRDCAEYTVTTPGGGHVVVLVNHFKSKGYGGQAANNARRKRQAERVAEIYKALRAVGEKAIVVLGDLNDTLDSAPLAPLLTGTDLADITSSPNFTPDPDGRPGTFGNGTKSGKIDCVLLSPFLFQRVTGGLIFRQGAWGGKNGTLWAHYPTITRAVEAASDHAAIYADINV
jgi:endonuclease/exonuclease/phosphatase family metal-dependent hydrolase